MFRMLVAGIFALALPLAASAGAVVESLKGSAMAGDAALAQGQRLVAPVVITTEPGTQVFLKFDDGMQIVLHENSLRRMLDFRHTESGVTDRAVFELLKGAARVVTGTVARNNPKQFFFRTPHTQLTVERPADFTVALVNPAYIAVKSGTVLSSNGAGVVPLNAGTTSVIAGNAAAPASIAASAMPASASSAMSNLGLAAVGAPPAGGAAAGVATVAGGTAGAGFVVPAMLVGLGIGAAAVANMDDDAPPASTPTTSHH
jgi:hypothetical protein